MPSPPPLVQFILTILSILPLLQSQSLTLSSSSVSPNYAKSLSSLYSFSFNAVSSFQTNFDLRIYYPSQYALTAPTSCAFYVNNIIKSAAVCSLSSSTNEIVFSNLNIVQSISNIKIEYRSSTARYSGSSTLTFNYINPTTNTTITNLTNYISLTIVNAIMSCSASSTSNIVGDSVTYSLSYTPLVAIQTNSILQIQIQPWGPYSQSNFITTNVSLICNGGCTLSLPNTNANVSEIVRFASLFTSETSAAGVVSLAKARNPASTRAITMSIVMLAKITSISQQPYMNCSTTFSVSTPNSFKLTNFAPSNTAISVKNIVTLRLQVTNPVSSISYIRIQPSILSLTFQLNSYNQLTQVFLSPTSDGSILLGNLTASTTTSPTIMTLNNFTLYNPPYANKPVTITFTTENLVDSVFYLIDKGTVDIVSAASTIVQFGIAITTTSINAISKYTLWFKTINKLITTSFITVTFPSTINIGSSTCSMTSTVCTVINSTSLYIDVNNIFSEASNLTLTLFSAVNPPTTTPTDTIVVRTYYQDSLSLVDELTSGFTVTATSVPFKSVQLTPTSSIVGKITDYSLSVQIANSLPQYSYMRVRIPTSTFPTTQLILKQFSIGGTVIPGCSITTISSMFIKVESTCFPTNTPASTILKLVLSNVTNPLSTKTSDTWQVQTFYNDLQMEYLFTGVTVTMQQPTQLTSLSITPTSQVVNAATPYQFDITFLYPHWSGDRVILTIPEGVLINSGFQCVAISSGVSVSCFQSSSVLQVTVTLTNTSKSITQLSFKINSLTNNWYASTRTISVQTTTNDSTYYYVEAGQNTVNYISTLLPTSVVSNQQIILLGDSTVKFTITTPFVLNRATDFTLLNVVLNVPTDLLPYAGTCSLSVIGATCALNGQVINITGPSDFSTVTITFKAMTTYFLNSSIFSSQLSYNSSLIASDSSTKLSSYCTNPCKQCTSTRTQCLSCLPTPQTVNNTLLPLNSTCVNVCPSTYFALSGTCTACNTSACLDCSATANNCTSCQSGKLLYSNGCLDSCPAQFYPSSGVCLACVAPCLTCNSASVCLTCRTGYFLDTNSKCVLTCSNVSYIGLNGTCQACINNCLTCSQSLSNCTTCSNQYLLFNNTCVRACSTGYYNNANSTCTVCPFPCTTCSSATKCQSCNSSYYLYNSTTCTNKCPDGTLAVVTACQNCDSKCATCSVVVTNCTKCSVSYLFYNNDCVQTCPANYHPYNGTCSLCIDPCVTCTNDPTICSSCVTGKYLLNSTCLDACPTNGYYTQSQSCLPCTQNCLSCQTLRTCNLCSSGYYLLSGGCVSSCPQSNPIVQNRECTGCSSQCSTCSGSPTNCTTCTVFYFKYLYTCVQNCPITYYSNTVNYQCEDGLSSKIVFFPVLITSFVVIGVLLIIKIFARETSFITTVAAFLSPLQLAIWAYVLSLMFATYKEPDVAYTIPMVLLIIAIFSYFFLAVVFFFVNKKKMQSDQYATQWCSNNINYTISIIIRFSSLLLGCKFFRILYSRLFNSITLSIVYRSRSNVFTVATVFTLFFFLFSEILAIVSCWFLIYNKALKDQTFYTSIEGLIVTIIAAVFALIDIYKAEDYFQESEFWKIKKFVQKVKDFSTMNKLEEGFEVSHQEGSVDAERFVSTSGGKFFYSKQKPQDIKDQFYFQENQGVSQATDIFQTDKKGKNKSNAKNINIFGPIIEQEAEYYETQKYGQQQIHRQTTLSENRRKIKTFGSDDEEQAADKAQRRQQLGPEQNFDDTKSLIGERDVKNKWNKMLDKRMQLAEKIFNRHPLNLEQIDQPMMEDQDQNQESNAKIIRHLDYEDKNMLGTQSQINAKKRHRKKKKVRNNKELEEIYLQRLTQKKQKSTKDMFISDKSLKYDF